MNSSNIERFGTVMANRMKQTSNAAIPTTIELATVNSNMSITPDSLGAPIPKGEYMVNLMLTGSKITSKTEHSHSGGAHEQEVGSGVHSHTGGEHDHGLPETLRNIQPGDRVVIAWCGNEPVVIAIAVSS
jgi:hypothetical protein